MLTTWLKSVFPQRCVGCGHPLRKQEDHLCHTCVDSIPTWPSEHQSTHFAEEIFAGRTPISRLVIYAPFHTNSHIQKALHAIKYDNAKGLAREFGRLLGVKWKAESIENTCILPIPLHPEKESARGYNQSLLLAEGLSEVTGFPIWNGLERVTNTSTQTALNRQDRWENVASAFQSTQLPPERDNVILLDDTLTTGATIEAAANALPSIKGKLFASALAYAP